MDHLYKYKIIPTGIIHDLSTGSVKARSSLGGGNKRVKN